MKLFSAPVLLLAAAPAFFGCARESSALNGRADAPTTQVASPAVPDQSTTAAITDNGPRELLGEMASVHTGDEPLTLAGYQVSRKIRLEKLPSGYANEIEYAIIKKPNGRSISLNGFVETGSGAFLRLGAYPLLGAQTRQLVVEQTVHRGWRYWVVDLSDDARIVFDNGLYPVGHDLRAADLDSDGRLELQQLLHTFWFFNSKLNNTNSPLIRVIFKYDPAVRKYVPANPEFRALLLRDIEAGKEKVKKIKEAKALTDAAQYDAVLFGAVLDITLTYLYAGMEQEGWDYFEEYDSADKSKMKQDVLTALRSDPIYRTVGHASMQ